MSKKRLTIRIIAILLVLASIVMTWQWFDLSKWLSDLDLLLHQPLWLAIMLTAYLSSFLLKTAAWKLYESTAQVKFSLLFHAILYSLLLNHLLPIKAGDAVRAGVFMKQADKSWDEALHSVAVMRLLDMLVLGTICGVGVVALGLHSTWIWFLALLAAAVLLAIGRYLPWLRKLPFVSKHSDLFRTRMLSVKGLFIVGTVGLSWLLEGGVIYGVAHLLAIPLGAGPLIWANGMTIAGQTFHITPGGIGTYESTMSGSLRLLGTEGELAYRAALLSHSFKFLFAFVIGAYAMLRMPLDWQEMKRWVHQLTKRPPITEHERTPV